MERSNDGQDSPQPPQRTYHVVRGCESPKVPSWGGNRRREQQDKGASAVLAQLSLSNAGPPARPKHAFAT